MVHSEQSTVQHQQKEAKTHTTVYITGAEVEQVNSYRFLEVTITENFCHHTSPSWLKDAQKSLLFLQKFRKT